MSFADIRLVIGTRPEAIKLAPLAHALAARGLPPALICTGQHRDLDPGEFGFAGFAVDHLGCPGEQNPHVHVRAVTEALIPRLSGGADLLIVQGDTSSALGGALAAFKLRVPVAHVEAGLRTHDPRQPWPEEEYRTAIDAEADLLFAPTAGAAANLEAEQVPGEIHVTGNTGIDAVLQAEARLPEPTLHDRSQPLLLVTCHRRENWGEGLHSLARAVAELARDAKIQFVLHPNAHVAAEMRALLGDISRVELLEPQTHDALLQRMRQADLVISDSGGIQEEAPAIGVPLLVLREKTERPEGIAIGSARLVGTSSKQVVHEARWLLADPLARAAMSRRSFPYGDGRAAPRIAEIVDQWLERKRALSPAAPSRPRQLGSW